MWSGKRRRLPATSIQQVVYTQWRSAVWKKRYKRVHPRDQETVETNRKELKRAFDKYNARKVGFRHPSQMTTRLLHLRDWERTSKYIMLSSIRGHLLLTTRGLVGYLGFPDAFTCKTSIGLFQYSDLHHMWFHYCVDSCDYRGSHIITHKKEYDEYIDKHFGMLTKVFPCRDIFMHILDFLIPRQMILPRIL